MRALTSAQCQLTVTGEVYRPLVPVVPVVTAGVADGVVTSTVLVQPSL